MSIRIDYIDPNKSVPQVCWQLNERLAILYGYTHRNQITITRVRDDATLCDITVEILEEIEAYEGKQAAKAAQTKIELDAMEAMPGFGSF
jgi:hypothetical protein